MYFTRRRIYIFIVSGWLLTSVGPHPCEASIQKQCEGCADTARGRIDSDHNLLVAKVRTRLKKIIRFQKSRPRWDLEKLYAQRQRVQDTLEEKLGAIECESGIAEVQCKNIRENMLETVGDLVGKNKKRARNPWITQEMISKMDERRIWKNVNTEEGRRKNRRLRKEFKRATEKTKKEYLENTCTEIMEFHRTGRYDLMYIKTKELGWKETPRDSKYWHRRLPGE